MMKQINTFAIVLSTFMIQTYGETSSRAIAMVDETTGTIIENKANNNETMSCSSIEKIQKNINIAIDNGDDNRGLPDDFENRWAARFAHKIHIPECGKNFLRTVCHHGSDACATYLRMCGLADG